MKDLWNKIKTPIKVGALATILSFLLVKEAKGQYYGKLGLSGKNMSNSTINEYFGMISGVKAAVGIGIEWRSRIESELGLFGEKNKKEELKMNIIEGGAYYDIVLNPDKNLQIYAGAGLKGMGYTFKDLKYDYEEKVSGIGYGLRGGIEISIGNLAWLYFEMNYSEITGEYDGDNVDMSGSEITVGLKVKL